MPGRTTTFLLVRRIAGACLAGALAAGAVVAAMQSPTSPRLTGEAPRQQLRTFDRLSRGATLTLLGDALQQDRQK